MFRAEPDSIAGQIGRGLASVLRQKGGSVTLRLNPESLGQLKISLSFDESRVSAKFEASNPEARQLLARHADSLRQVLESRGLSVESLRVVAPDPSVPGGEPPTTRDAGNDARSDAGTGSYSQHPAGSPDGGSHGKNDQSQQSMGGAPWGSTSVGPDHPAQAPTDGSGPEPGQWHVGTDADELWLRLDAIA